MVGGGGDRKDRTAEPEIEAGGPDHPLVGDPSEGADGASSSRKVFRPKKPKAPRRPPTDEARLSRIFGELVPEDELRIWASIPPSQRDKALQRMAALDRFCGGEPGLTAKQAAADAGVELGRFYQIARAWSAKRSLANLGAYASVTQRRQRLNPEAVNSLQAVVARVVKANKGASVTRLAQLLAEASGLAPDLIPKKNTLRMFVEREQRRVRATRQAGNEVLFDCSAISLTRDDGWLHTVFLAIDDGTGLVLGHAVGELGASADGYRGAARNALLRISGGPLSAVGIWAPTLERTQLVPGTDIDLLGRLVAALVTDLGGVAPQLTRVGVPGRYIRSHLGQKLGPIQLLPSRTTLATRPATPGGEALTPADADARVELAVTAHNAEVLTGTAADGGREPPEKLLRLLAAMAGHERRRAD